MTDCRMIRMIKRGDAVISLAGRDSGCVMLVVSTDGEYALVCDGKKRPLEKPKRKKLRHLRRLSSMAYLSDTSDISDMTNRRLRRLLREYVEESTGNDIIK